MLASPDAHISRTDPDSRWWRERAALARTAATCRSSARRHLAPRSVDHGQPLPIDQCVQQLRAAGRRYRQGEAHYASRGRARARGYGRASMPMQTPCDPVVRPPSTRSPRSRLEWTHCMPRTMAEVATKVAHAVLACTHPSEEHAWRAPVAGSPAHPGPPAWTSASAIQPVSALARPDQSGIGGNFRSIRCGQRRCARGRCRWRGSSMSWCVARQPRPTQCGPCT